MLVFGPVRSRSTLPLRRVSGIRVQRLDHRDDQILVQPAPAGAEAVDDNGLADVLADRSAEGSMNRPGSGSTTNVSIDSRGDGMAHLPNRRLSRGRVSG